MNLTLLAQITVDICVNTLSFLCDMSHTKGVEMQLADLAVRFLLPSFH